MKTHFVTLLFNLPNGKLLSFSGLVKGKIFNNKLVVDPNKIFQAAFGYVMPNNTIINY